MTRRQAWLTRFAMLVAAVILATVALGWMGVVFVGVLFAAVDGRDSAAAESGASAAVGWMLILLVTGMTAGARPLGVIGSARVCALRRGCP